MDLNDDKQVREALEAGEIILSEYRDLRPSERAKPGAVNTVSRMLLLRAEDARLALQGRTGMLLRHEYGGPSAGLSVFYDEEGRPTRVVYGTLVKAVKADDGAISDETGEFVKFPPLFIFKPSEAHERFDQWWGRTLAPLIEYHLKQALGEGPASTLLFVRTLAAAAWRASERRAGR